MKKLLLVFSLFSFGVSANPFCSSILQNGIYDSNNTFNSYNEFKIAQKIHCDKRVSNSQRGSDSGGDIGYAGFTFGGSHKESKTKEESAEFCKMSYDEYSSSGKYNSAVKKINQGIVSAWSSCIKSNLQQVSHYIQPSLDSSKFTYKILFTPDVDNERRSIGLKNWLVDGATCKNELKAGDIVSPSGTELLCKRKPKNVVTIVANPEKYGKNLRRIELPKHIPYTPPQQNTYYEKLKEYISLGKRFSISFDYNPSDTSCGIKSGTGYIGNLMAGKTYTVYYIPATETWVTEGPMQHFANCGNYSSIADNNRLKFNPNKAEINIWVGIMMFDEKGYVYYGDKKIGKINNPLN